MERIDIHEHRENSYFEKMVASSLNKKLVEGNLPSNTLRKKFTVIGASIFFISFWRIRLDNTVLNKLEFVRNLGIGESPTKRTEIIIKPSEAFQDGQFDPWVNNYINFHQSAIKDGRLKNGVRYVVYKCSDKERCGGVGDRVLSMVRAFYFAMATGRVLLIDSKFPVELKKYLNPNFVKWDAEVPLTEEIFDDMSEKIPIGRRGNIIGYLLGRCNGNERYTISKIIQSQYMQTLIQQSAQGPLSELSVPRAFHQAFWAMFKFDDAVLSRAEEMKKRAGLALPSDGLNAFFQGSNSRKEMASYIGLHNRHGDKSISGVTSTWVEKQSRESNSTELLECYHQFQRIFPGKYQAAYLASDDHDTKKFMKEKDRTIHYPPEVNIFHVDLSTRNGTGVTSIDNDHIHQGVLDTWAEVAVLVDSDCLVMSRSMFAFLAYYIRGETTCNVYIMDCNAATVAKKMNTYSEDPISMIYNTIETHRRQKNRGKRRDRRKKKRIRLVRQNKKRREEREKMREEREKMSHLNNTKIKFKMQKTKKKSVFRGCKWINKEPYRINKICKTVYDWQDGASDYPMHRCNHTCSKCTECNNTDVAH